MSQCAACPTLIMPSKVDDHVRAPLDRPHAQVGLLRAREAGAVPRFGRGDAVHLSSRRLPAGRATVVDQLDVSRGIRGQTTVPMLPNILTIHVHVAMLALKFVVSTCPRAACLRGAPRAWTSLT